MARGDIDAYKLRNPDAGEVPLVFEIAESSILADRTEMARIYGGGGIPLYWIVNLVDGQIEEYSDPDPAGGYRTRTDHHPGQSISVTLEGLDLGKVAGAPFPVAPAREEEKGVTNIDLMRAKEPRDMHVKA